MKLLINEQQKSYDNEKICYICKENLENKCNMKNIVKLKIIVIIQRNIKVLRIAYVIWDKMEIKKYGSSHDYHLS